MRGLAAAGAALLLLAGCGRDEQAQRTNRTALPGSNTGPAQQAGVTPMAERVAVLGLLNKRNGIVRDLTLKPGQSLRVNDAIVRLRACETTAPWENETLTGAFVQLDVQQPNESWHRVFSGWIYKESPSLNVVEHPVYDVWPKSCAMTYPAGPGAPAAPVASSNRSSASRSGGEAEPAPEAPAEPPPTAETAPAPTPAPEPATPPPPSAPESNET